MQYNMGIMGKIVGTANIADDFRMYVPPPVREMLSLEIGDELVFELDNNKLLVWRQKIDRELIRDFKQIKG